MVLFQVGNTNLCRYCRLETLPLSALSAALSLCFCRMSNAQTYSGFDIQSSLPSVSLLVTRFWHVKQALTTSVRSSSLTAWMVSLHSANRVSYRRSFVSSLAA